MGYFYFDESIRARGNFIVGAFIYSEHDLTPDVFQSLSDLGFSPEVDEFKSGVRMIENPSMAKLRDKISDILQSAKIGIIILPVDKRDELGNEAILGLEKFITANGLENTSHSIFIDEGIPYEHELLKKFVESHGSCDIKFNQDSKIIGGIQVADMAAHTCAFMLEEQMGLISKKVRVGEGEGYEPDLEIELGFIFWASLRYSFFKALTKELPEDFSNEDLVFDMAQYGLHISNHCSDALRTAALSRFGECYMGCIH